MTAQPPKARDTGFEGPYRRNPSRTLRAIFIVLAIFAAGALLSHFGAI